MPGAMGRLAPLSRVRALWWRVDGSLWFVPALLVLGATVLAIGLVYLDELFTLELQERWPRIFGVGAQGSRSLLSAIATTMLTVAGTVFSVTLAVLSLAASQYSPRVLRTFIGDRPTQWVLGVFVGVFAYCLVVLRTIRGGETQFVPSLAVLGGIVLAFVAVGFLVYFIHHLSASIEASTILKRLTHGTAAAIDSLFPEELGEELQAAYGVEQAIGSRAWTPVACAASGYVVTVDNAGLLRLAREEGRIVRMALAVGDFATEGLPLAWLEGAAPVREPAGRALGRCYTFEPQRTIKQDASFGLQQIVDVGLKALSPGINDQSTAILCIDRLGELLVRLARRRIETPLRGDGEVLRVIARGPSFEGLLALSFRDLCEAGATKPAVLERVLEAIERVGSVAGNADRRKALAREAGRVSECATRALQPPAEREHIVRRAERLAGALTAGGAFAAPPEGARSRP